MGNSSIPRQELETFATESYKIPLFEVQHYPVDSNYFIVQNRETYPVKDYISPHRRNFYKVFHMTSGTGILTVGLHQYEMGPDEIGFLHPDEIVSWRTTSKETGGHFCLIHPDFFGRDAVHVWQWLKQFPYFLPEKAVVQLQQDQSAAINGYFSTMLREAQSDNDDNRQAIMLQLQLLLLESQRAGKTRVQTDVQESYGHIYKFLSLLETSFQVRDTNAINKLKTAAEFANELHVHPNYLNSLVKKHTGKTVRDHIQERLLHEAKTLLVHTDWGINEISDGLGFSGQAAFTSFFKKKEDVSPLAYRKAVSYGKVG